MLSEAIANIIERDLNKLKTEINAYPDEAKLWVVEKGISNSAGNLCLHLLGNINHFVGATLGGTGYVRNRDKEFADKNVPRQELVTNIDKAIAVVKATLPKITDADLEKTYPIKVLPEEVTTGYFMVNVAVHLDYHLGQINYHRRLLAG